MMKWILMGLFPIVLYAVHEPDYSYDENQVRYEHYSSSPGEYNWLFFPNGPGIDSGYLRSLASQLELPGDVWLIDLPGNGTNVVDEAGYEYDQWFALFLLTVERFQNPVIVGHGFGGELPLWYPELEGKVSGLVLLDNTRRLTLAYDCSIDPSTVVNRIFFGNIDQQLGAAESSGSLTITGTVSPAISEMNIDGVICCGDLSKVEGVELESGPGSSSLEVELVSSSSAPEQVALDPVRPFRQEIGTGPFMRIRNDFSEALDSVGDEAEVSLPVVSYETTSVGFRYFSDAVQRRATRWWDGKSAEIEGRNRWIPQGVPTLILVGVGPEPGTYRLARHNKGGLCLRPESLLVDRYTAENFTITLVIPALERGWVEYPEIYQDEFEFFLHDQLEAR